MDSLIFTELFQSKIKSKESNLPITNSSISSSKQSVNSIISNESKKDQNKRHSPLNNFTSNVSYEINEQFTKTIDSNSIRIEQVKEKIKNGFRSLQK
jgi:mannitol-specific phosphotransferase system IIBC component